MIPVLLLLSVIQMTMEMSVGLDNKEVQPGDDVIVITK